MTKENKPLMELCKASQNGVLKKEIKMTKEKMRLKPCPFCGDEASLVEAKKVNCPYYDPPENKYFYVCHYCECLGHIKTDGFDKKIYAVKAWNRRANV